MIDKKKRRRERSTYQSEPREYEVEKLVYHFDVDPEFAN